MLPKLNSTLHRFRISLEEMRKKPLDELSGMLYIAGIKGNQLRYKVGKHALILAHREEGIVYMASKKENLRKATDEEVAFLKAAIFPEQW